MTNPEVYNVPPRPGTPRSRAPERRESVMRLVRLGAAVKPGSHPYGEDAQFLVGLDALRLDRRGVAVLHGAELTVMARLGVEGA